jgi:F0F1-type ATP synthase epsilon subunit
MKHRPILIATACVIGMALVSGMAAAARESEVLRPREKMVRTIAEWNTSGDPREMIKIFRAWILTGALDLTDEQVPVFVARLERLDESREVAAASERELMARLDSLLADKHAADDELARALARLEEARRANADQLRAMREETLAGLTVRQRCAYEVSDGRFRQDVRLMVDRARLEHRKRWDRDLLRKLVPFDRARGRRG